MNQAAVVDWPPKRWRRAKIIRLQHALTVSVMLALAAKGADPLQSPAAILQELRSFNTLGTVLHIAAHPDDENTQLITYFARSRGYRTAYLSLTRGDGGQNEIGPEFDEKLGVARTQELLAARQLDGGRQFFTRAIDFGYSKNPEETLRFWNREQVLGDIVRVIRRFQPDVIVTRFPIPPGSGGHGHHTASGILGVEAFKLAGDPEAYPEQIAEGLAPWQPKRVAWNGFGQQRGASLSGPTVRVDIGGKDPVTGEGLGAIAGRSRGRHITQGFGNFGGGGGGGTGPNEQTFMVLGGEPAEKDLMDGVDTTWARFPGGDEIGQLAQKAIAAFDTNAPARSVPQLLAIRAKLGALPSNPVINDKREQLDAILQSCLGLRVETTATQPEVVPGETLKLQQTVKLTGDVPVRWVETRMRYPKSATRAEVRLQSGDSKRGELIVTAPADAPLTQPYWLREPWASGSYRVNDSALIGTPENAPTFPVDYVFEVNGQTLVVSDEPKCFVKDDKAERHRRMDVIPPVTLCFAAGVVLLQPASTHAVTVEITAARANTEGSLQLEVPADWKVSPASHDFRLTKVGEKKQFSFNVTSPAKPTVAQMTASVVVNNHRYANQRIEINYAHLPFILLQPRAQARLLAVDFAVRGKNVGYLPGAGDDTAAALEQLGYTVTTLNGTDLTDEKLKKLDAVVIGVRAFNERTDLAANLTNLFTYVENGGTVIAQYNRPNGLKAQQLGPYKMSIQGQAPQLRVTDERAPVTFLAPDHAALTTPNKIGPADFDGWFQERGAYFPSSWDKEHYETVLAMADPGEPPLQSSLLIAKHGKGYYVYTGLAFFRQLPQGVPGAYRLFANLVSLGK
ncbi:MAG TPA: PIG-L family deacetylase [Verrucomicrobiae bacterium]|nr:PIG-L family deacetylase [Verrucomicrobiae bacterium]